MKSYVIAGVWRDYDNYDTVTRDYNPLATSISKQVAETYANQVRIAREDAIQIVSKIDQLISEWVTNNPFPRQPFNDPKPIPPIYPDQLAQFQQDLKAWHKKSSRIGNENHLAHKRWMEAYNIESTRIKDSHPLTKLQIEIHGYYSSIVVLEVDNLDLID